MHVDELGRAPELEATIQSMEVAFRMQTEAPDVFDIRKESQATRDRYGVSEFGRGCLMARRLVERGVRMVQLYHGPWDHHADIMGHKISAAQIDGPIATLIQDSETARTLAGYAGHSAPASLAGRRSSIWAGSARCTMAGITIFTASRCCWREAA